MYKRGIQETLQLLNWQIGDRACESQPESCGLDLYQRHSYPCTLTVSTERMDDKNETWIENGKFTIENMGRTYNIYHGVKIKCMLCFWDLVGLENKGRDMRRIIGPFQSVTVAQRNRTLAKISQFGFPLDTYSFILTISLE